MNPFATEVHALGDAAARRPDAVDSQFVEPLFFAYIKPPTPTAPIIIGCFAFETTLAAIAFAADSIAKPDDSIVSYTTPT